MKKVIVLALMFLLIFHTSFSAIALDKNKLMSLKPLPSERLAQLAQDAENSKIWGSLGMGLLGLGVLSANASEPLDSYRVQNIYWGSAFILIAWQLYSTPSFYETDRKVLAEIGSDGVDKELNAYYLLKTYSEKTKIQRKAGSVTMGFMGLVIGALASSASDASSEYKESLYIGSAIFVLMGIMSYFNPSPIENEVAEMDQELK